MNLFYKVSKSEKKKKKKKKKKIARGEGGGIDGWTDEQAHKPICSFNFFEVGGMTMH